MATSEKRGTRIRDGTKFRRRATDDKAIIETSVWELWLGSCGATGAERGGRLKGGGVRETE